MTRTETNKAARAELAAIETKIAELEERRVALAALLGSGEKPRPKPKRTKPRMTAQQRQPLIVDYLRKHAVPNSPITTADLAAALDWWHASTANALVGLAEEGKIEVLERSATGMPSKIAYKPTKVRPGEEVKG